MCSRFGLKCSSELICLIQGVCAADLCLAGNYTQVFAYTNSTFLTGGSYELRTEAMRENMKQRLASE